MKTVVCNSAKLEFMQGVHLPSDRYMIALYTSEAKLDEKTTVYSVEDEVTNDGYDVGGKTLSAAQLSLNKKGEAVMSFTTPIIWENAWISARGAMIYNASKGNKALAVFEFTDDDDKPRTFTSSSGPFSVKIPNEGAIILS